MRVNYFEDWSRETAIPYLIFECIAGSRMYGTNTKDSDYDFRGVLIPPAIVREDPFESFGQFEGINEDENTTVDFVWWSLKKFFFMASKGNPNILELLFAPQESWTVRTSAWRHLVANRNIFISKACAKSFAGFAVRQAKDVFEKGDGKAALHYFRLMGQAQELFSTGKITFPRPDAKELMKYRNMINDDVRKIFSSSYDIAETTFNYMETSFGLGNHPDKTDPLKLRQLYWEVMDLAGRE